MEAVLGMEITWELQFNLEEKESPSILKVDFSSRTDPSILKSVAAMLLDQEWSLEEHQHLLDFLKTSHSEPLKAIYYWEKTK